MPNVNIFADRSKLELMLVLRLSGFTPDTLAFMFGCDESSIKYQCKRNNVKPLGGDISINTAIRQILATYLEDRWEVIDGERINKGRSYADLVKERYGILPPHIP